MTFRVSNIGKSLMRHIMDAIDQVRDAGISETLAYYAWDSRGEEAELAEVDLIGLAGWTFKENKGLWEVYAGLTISTVNDENLFREMAIVDAIHDMFGEDCSVPMRNDDGDEYTQLAVTEFEMLPAGNSEKRNYRPIGLQLKRTSSA